MQIRAAAGVAVNKGAYREACFDLHILYTVPVPGAAPTGTAVYVLENIIPCRGELESLLWN